MNLSVLVLTLSVVCGLARAENLGDVYSLDGKGWLEDQWEKARIQGSTGVFVDVGIAHGGVKYRYRVEPAFVKGLHQRTDLWRAEIGADTLRLHGKNPVTLGGTVATQVIFSRLFDNKEAALLKKPYFINKIPWTSQKALEELKEGDAFRLETFFDLHLGLEGNKSIGAFGVSVKAAQERGLRFLADVYRLPNNRVRLRLIGQRNDGINSLGINVNPLNKLDFGTGIIKRALNNAVGCDLLDTKGTLANLEKPPVDTLMVDYVFNLNSPDAQQAYDKVMDQIYHFNYSEALDIRNLLGDRKTDTDRIVNEISKFIESADQIFYKDRSSEPKNRRVHRVFKGISRSAIAGYQVQTECARLWNMKFTDFTSKTLIENYDQNDAITYQIFENVEVAALNMQAASLYQESSKRSMSVMHDANSEFSPVALSDIVMTTESLDKDFKIKEYNALKSQLKFALPSKIFEEINWTPFEKENKAKLNVSYRYDFILHKNGVAALPSMDGREAYERIYKYVKNYPGREYLEVSVNPFRDSETGVNNYSMDRFQYDLNELSAPLGRMLNKEYDSQTRAEAFAVVRENLLFRQVGPGFLISLLPPDTAHQLLSFRLNVNGPGDQQVSYNNSIDSLSDTYKSLEYIVRNLTDRELDLRLQIEAGGFPER